MAQGKIDTDDLDESTRNSLQQSKFNMDKNKNMNQKKASDWNKLWNVGGNQQE